MDGKTALSRLGAAVQLRGEKWVKELIESVKECHGFMMEVKDGPGMRGVEFMYESYGWNGQIVVSDERMKEPLSSSMKNLKHGIQIIGGSDDDIKPVVDEDAVIKDKEMREKSYQVCREMMKKNKKWMESAEAKEEARLAGYDSSFSGNEEYKDDDDDDDAAGEDDAASGEDDDGVEEEDEDLRDEIKTEFAVVDRSTDEDRLSEENGFSVSDESDD